MVKTTMSEERLRSIIRKIVREELKKNSKENEQDTQQASIQSSKNSTTASISESGPWAVFGAPKPDPAKNFKRLERPRALPGWSEPYQDGDKTGPYRPKRTV